MGVEFKVKIMLHGFREVKFGGRLVRWERWKGNEVATWERRESGEVRKWEVPGFIQGWGTQGESRFHLFVSDVTQGNKGDGLKIFLCAQRDGKTLLRSSVSC